VPLVWEVCTLDSGALIQLANYHGAYTMATCSKEKNGLLEKLGCREIYNYKEGQFCKKADVIIDFVGQSFWEKYLDLIEMDGRIIVLGLMSGSKLPSLDLGTVLKKRVHIIGSTLRNRPDSYLLRLKQMFEETILPNLGGAFNPVIDSVYEQKDLEAALARLSSNLNAGKIIIKVNHSV
jgi:tumor protein p53-inducible protein 3